MQDLIKGANAPLPAAPGVMRLRWRSGARAIAVDASAFLLAATGRVRGDADMVFYGQRSAPGLGLKEADAAAGEWRESVFAVDPEKLPQDVVRVAFTVVVAPESGARGIGDLGALEAVYEAGGSVTRYPVEVAGAIEAALVVVEIYRRGGDWKLRAVGQGFSGGLRPLAESFGVEVDDEPDPPSPMPKPGVDLRKRLVDLRKRDPQLALSAEKAFVSLEKRGLSGLRAKVALVLDISGSMEQMFRDGRVATLVRRALATALPMDDDGSIDVFLFGRRAHAYGTIDEATYRAFPVECRRRFPFEPATMYGEAIELVRRHYRVSFSDGLPVYVLFVTDGGTQDVRKSMDMIVAASAEPIFWQFMAIGEHEGKAPVKPGRVLPRGFDFLAMLDTMEGRVVDNANFFAVADPSSPSDEELYDLLFAEFPDWLVHARRAGILK